MKVTGGTIEHYRPEADHNNVSFQDNMASTTTDSNFSPITFATDILMKVVTLCQSNSSQQTYNRHTQHDPQIKEVAEQLECNYDFAFNQLEFVKDIYAQHPEFMDAISKDDQYGGFCLGLSLNWCHAKMTGVSDQEYEQALSDPIHSAALLKTIGLQTVVQNNSSSFSAEDISSHCTSHAGLDYIAASPNRITHRVPTSNIVGMANKLDSIWHNKKEQCLLLLTDDHAMALFRDKDKNLHFFNPNHGTVSVDADKDRSMYAFIYTLLNSDNSLWSNKVKNALKYLSATEVQLSNKLSTDKPTTLAYHELMGKLKVSS